MDLSEQPAVEPMDLGGDDRWGAYATGAVLLAIGWGLAVVVNVLLHLVAPAGGLALGPVVIGPHLGPFALITLGIGLGTGAVGAGVLWMARELPPGPFVLPGVNYAEPTPDRSAGTAAEAGP